MKPGTAWAGWQHEASSRVERTWSRCGTVDKPVVPVVREPRLMTRRVEQAWRLRWYGIISCAAARSFVASLLGLRGGHGSDGHAPPSHEVERDQAAAFSD